VNKYSTILLTFVNVFSTSKLNNLDKIVKTLRARIWG